MRSDFNVTEMKLPIDGIKLYLTLSSPN